ncbi:hypothetical protein [Microcoleus sp. B4-D4]
MTQNRPNTVIKWRWGDLQLRLDWVEVRSTRLCDRLYDHFRVLD